MSYSITLTNGTVKADIADGTVDQTKTDLTLVGKNVSSYGSYINNNFVHLLENFANSTEPNHPILGQLWYDTAFNRLKVYNGVGFVSTNSTTVGTSAPSSTSAGDLFVNSQSGQLFFNDGTNNILAGPLYTTSQGRSGFEVDNILEKDSNSEHTVMYLYLGKSLLGVFAKERFIPRDDIPGYPSGSYLEIGFNVSSFAGVKFNVPVNSAENLLDSNGNLIPPEDFLSKSSETSVISGSLFVENAVPLVLGTLNSSEIQVNNSAFTIQSNSSNQNFRINLKNGSTDTTAIFVDASQDRIGIYNTSPTATLTVAGTGHFDSDVTVSGKVTVGTEPTELEDVATKNYVDTRPLPLSINSTSNTIAVTVLTKVFPASEHPDGTIARVVYSDSTVHKFILSTGVWSHDSVL